MRSSAAARRYARALFSIAQEQSAVPAIRGELDDMAGTLADNPALEHSLFRPLHPVAQRQALLRSLCEQAGTSGLLRNFYGLLIDHRRLIDFHAIRTEYGRLADEAAGRRRAEVVSASPLNDAQRQRLRGALASRTGGEVELDERVDPSLLGGAIAKVGDLVFDGSLRTQLSQLRASLTRGQ